MVLIDGVDGPRDDLNTGASKGRSSQVPSRDGIKELDEPAVQTLFIVTQRSGGFKPGDDVTPEKTLGHDQPEASCRKPYLVSAREFETYLPASGTIAYHQDSARRELRRVAVSGSVELLDINR